MNFIHYAIGNGRNTGLWYDLRCGSKPIIENEIAVLELDYLDDTKVADLIEDSK